MRAELRTTWDGARPWVELRSPRKGHWGDSQAIEEFFFFWLLSKSSLSRRCSRSRFGDQEAGRRDAKGAQEAQAAQAALREGGSF